MLSRSLFLSAAARMSAGIAVSQSIWGGGRKDPPVADNAESRQL
jgi:hypothetical protein